MDYGKEHIRVFDKYASAYQEKFMGLDLYNDTYDIFCTLVKENARVLEIGCGPGNITKYILKKRPDLRLKGIDFAPNMIRLARENNPGATFEVMDCRDIIKLKEKFDAIICGFCMPYLSKEECEKLVADSAALLNEDGIFYFSVIEDDYGKSGLETSSNGQDKSFVYYHEEEYLRKFLEKNNFKIVSTKRKRYENAQHPVHLIIIAEYC